MPPAPSTPSEAPAPAGGPSNVASGLTLFGLLTMVYGFYYWHGLGGGAVEFYSVWLALTGAALLVLGGGSIRGQRWARALLVCWAGWQVWQDAWQVLNRVVSQLLVAGYVATGEYFHELVLFCLLGLAWVWFYTRPAVKSECEARHPRPAWTDACPLPVLFAGFFLLMELWLGGLAFVPSFLMYAGQPFYPWWEAFAHLIGALFLVALAGAAAWQLYRGRRGGWWLLATSWGADAGLLVGKAGKDFLEMLFSDAPTWPGEPVPSMVATWACWGLLFAALAAKLLYILWLRRFFWPTAASEHPPAPLPQEPAS